MVMPGSFIARPKRPPVHVEQICRLPPSHPLRLPCLIQLLELHRPGLPQRLCPSRRSLLAGEIQNRRQYPSRPHGERREFPSRRAQKKSNPRHRSPCKRIVPFHATGFPARTREADRRKKPGTSRKTPDEEAVRIFEIFPIRRLKDSLYGYVQNDSCLNFENA